MRCSIGITIAALTLAFACETRAAERDFAPFLVALSSGEFVDELLEQFSKDDIRATQLVEGLNRIASDPDAPAKSRELAIGILCQPIVEASAKLTAAVHEGTIPALKCAALDPATTDQVRLTAVHGLYILAMANRDSALALLEVAHEQHAAEATRCQALEISALRRSVRPECEHEVLRILRSKSSTEMKLSAVNCLERMYFAECLGDQVEAGLPASQLRFNAPQDRRLLWRLVLIAAAVRLNPYQPAEVRESAHFAIFHLWMFSRMAGEPVVD